MSSAVVSTPAALGRPFVFEDEDEAEVRLPSSARRAALDRTAPSASLRAGEGGCPHINLTHKNPGAKISPASVTTASRLEIRPAPEMVSSGIPALDALTGGLPRGCLTEVCGPASSGRTTLLLAALAAATRRGEFCVVVDASDTLDPHSAAAAGVELERLLWVRCGDAPRKDSSPQRRKGTEKDRNQKDRNQNNGNQNDGRPISRAPFAREVGTREVCPEPAEGMGIYSQAAFDFERTRSEEGSSKKNVFRENPSRQSDHRLEQVLRATDLLLESGGFGLIVLDLGDLPAQAARRIPLTTWFRFRRAIEHTPTILLAIEQQAIAGSCSSLLLHLGGATEKSAVERREINLDQTEIPVHAQLFTGLNITAELVRSRLDRKPTRSIAFATRTAWAG